MPEVVMSDVVIENKCVAIVQFGPSTVTSGMRPAEYYQVTIDPEYVSPSGEYIRFGKYTGDEIQGWQRIDAITICEILAHYPQEGDVALPLTTGPIVMKSAEYKYAVDTETTQTLRGSISQPSGIKESRDTAAPSSTDGV